MITYRKMTTTVMPIEVHQLCSLLCPAYRNWKIAREERVAKRLVNVRELWLIAAGELEGIVSLKVRYSTAWKPQPDIASHMLSSTYTSIGV